MFPNSMENENSSQSWIHGIGTDGERIIADPVFLIYTWAEKPERLKRGCLHMLFHCLYQHPFSEKRWKKDYGMWPVIWLWSSDLEEYSGKFMAIFVRRTAKRKQILNF